MRGIIEQGRRICLPGGNQTRQQKDSLVVGGCAFLVWGGSNHGYPGAVAGQNMGIKIVNSAARQVIHWHSFIGDWRPDGIVDNHQVFTHKGHPDSI